MPLSEGSGSNAHREGRLGDPDKPFDYDGLAHGRVRPVVGRHDGVAIRVSACMEAASEDRRSHLAGLSGGRLIDLGEVAGEPPGESVARENEIVEAIARDDAEPGRPCKPSIEEQLRALIDPDRIRSR